MRVVGKAYRFGHFELDARERVLLADGEPVALQDLPMRLLIVLVERAPATVERRDLAAALWPPGTHLDVDASLNTAVARVREALGDGADRPRFVATVPRRGYRFVATVEVGAEPSAWRPRWGIASLILVALLLSVAALRFGRPDPSSASEPSASSEVAMEVRRHLLVGHLHTERRTREGLERGIAAFQSAAALDPESSEAYAGLALSYALLGIYDYWRPREALEPAETMARRALELDPDSPEALLAHGFVAAVGHWDWVTAEATFRRATELAPQSPEVWQVRGQLELLLGRPEQGLGFLRRALELDPTSPSLNASYAWQLFLARRPEEAVAQCQLTLTLHPDYFDAWDNLKWIEIRYGGEAAALEAWVRADDLENGGGEGVRQAYDRGGLAAIHGASIDKLTARWDRGDYQSPFDIALEHAALGRIDEALEWLERSLTERETDLIGLSVDPRFDALRDAPRFQELLAEVGLPTALGGDSGT